MLSKDSAGYQPVAWWFTKRRLGRELQNLYQAAEDLPPQFLALVKKLEGNSDSSLQAKSEGCGSSRQYECEPEAKLLTRDEARRIAANIAKLPEILSK